jgi:hypothetical protein
VLPVRAEPKIQIRFSGFMPLVSPATGRRQEFLRLWSLLEIRRLVRETLLLTLRTRSEALRLLITRHRTKNLSEESL